MRQETISSLLKNELRSMLNTQSRPVTCTLVRSAEVDEQLRGYQQNLLTRLRTGTSPGVRARNNSESEPADWSVISVLIAHSDPVISAGLAVLLQKNAKFKVLLCTRKRSNSQPASDPGESADVVLADYDSGIRLTAHAPESKSRVIILSHSDTRAKVCHALAHGVRGYFLLGCSLQDLTAGIRSVHEGGVAVTPRVASRITESMNQATLTAKQQSVLWLMALGRSNKQIAGELGLAVGTVKVHVKSIFAKLRVHNRVGAVAIARRCGILLDEPEWHEPCCAKG